MDKSKSQGYRTLRLIVLISFGFSLAAIVLSADAAYVGVRPIPNGVIAQDYLYTMYDQFTMVNHKGIDIPANLNTHVFAVARGTVVQLEESFADNTGSPPALEYGNYILN